MNETPSICIEVRAFLPGEESTLLRIFFDSVHGLAAVVYTATQLKAWAPLTQDRQQWRDRIARHHTLIAQLDGTPVGFIELAPNGSVEMLYRVPAASGLGIATRLHEAVEQHARAVNVSRLTTRASLVAVPFFLRQGYQIDEEEIVEIRGVSLLRKKMSKEL